jgi:hypothetical protein
MPLCLQKFSKKHGVILTRKGPCMVIEPTITRGPLSENAVFEKSKFDVSPTSVSELSNQ